MGGLQVRRNQIRVPSRHPKRGRGPNTFLEAKYCTHTDKTRGRCADELRTLLTREWQESAGIKGKLLSIGYGLATISRAAAQLTLTGEMQQDKRGRLTFWRIIRTDERR
jgi:hypothetical protein